MDFDSYSNNSVVLDFVNYFGKCIKNWKVNYTSNFKRIKLEDRYFNAQSISDALDKYVWPSNFTAPIPVKIGGRNFERGATVDVYHWAETRQALEFLSEGLTLAISNNDNRNCKIWCREIMNWGMGSRGDSALQFLNSQDSIAAYLISVQTAVAKDDLATITPDTVPKMGSGLSKIHSLASPGKLAILDSRVALTMGTCIMNFVEKRGLDSIPNELRLGYVGENRRPLGRQGIMYNPLTRDYHWLRSQLKMSWLLMLALDTCPDVFGGIPNDRRLHSLEACLFMFGAQRKNLETNLPPLQ